MNGQNNQDSTDLELKTQIELGQILKKFNQDPDFAKLIYVGYFEKKGNEAISQLTSRDDKTVKAAQDQLLAIAKFKEYILETENNAEIGEE